MWDYRKPTIEVDLTQDGLTEILPQAVYDGLVKRDKPTRTFVKELRDYNKNKRIGNQHIIPIVKTCARYANIHPTSWLDAIDLFGWDVACSLMPGVAPPRAVLHMMEDIQRRWPYDGDPEHQRNLLKVVRTVFQNMVNRCAEPSEWDVYLSRVESKLPLDLQFRRLERSTIREAHPV